MLMCSSHHTTHLKYIGTFTGQGTVGKACSKSRAARQGKYLNRTEDHTQTILYSSSGPFLWWVR